MISKELFEAVFIGCSFSHVEDNYIVHYSQPCNIIEGSWVESEITVYELTHECKEWASSLGFNICSGKADIDYDADSHISNYTIWYVALINLRIGAESYNSRHDVQRWLTDKEFQENSEVEAIFKACQWVLENK
jgi:hypothetical protein